MALSSLIMQKKTSIQFHLQLSNFLGISHWLSLGLGFDAATPRFLSEKELKSKGGPFCALWLNGRASFINFFWSSHFTYDNLISAEQRENPLPGPAGCTSFYAAQDTIEFMAASRHFWLMSKMLHGNTELYFPREVEKMHYRSHCNGFFLKRVFWMWQVSAGSFSQCLCIRGGNILLFLSQVSHSGINLLWIFHWGWLYTCPWQSFPTFICYNWRISFPTILFPCQCWFSRLKFQYSFISAVSSKWKYDLSNTRMTFIN